MLRNVTREGIHFLAYSISFFFLPVEEGEMTGNAVRAGRFSICAFTRACLGVSVTELKKCSLIAQESKGSGDLLIEVPLGSGIFEGLTLDMGSKLAGFCIARTSRS